MSVKGLEKQLSSKRNFGVFLQLREALELKIKNFPRSQVSRDLGQVRSKKLFPKKMIHKRFETNSSFHVK